MLNIVAVTVRSPPLRLWDRNIIHHVVATKRCDWTIQLRIGKAEETAQRVRWDVLGLKFYRHFNITKFAVQRRDCLVWKDWTTDWTDTPQWAADFDTALTPLFRLMHAEADHKPAALDSFIGLQTPRSWYVLAMLWEAGVLNTSGLFDWDPTLRNWYASRYVPSYSDGLGKDNGIRSHDNGQRQRWGRAEEWLRLGAVATILERCQEKVSWLRLKATKRLDNYFACERVSSKNQRSHVEWIDGGSGGRKRYPAAGTATFVRSDPIDGELSRFSDKLEMSQSQRMRLVSGLFQKLLLQGLAYSTGRPDNCLIPTSDDPVHCAKTHNRQYIGHCSQCSLIKYVEFCQVLDSVGLKVVQVQHEDLWPQLTLPGGKSKTTETQSESKTKRRSGNPFYILRIEETAHYQRPITAQEVGILTHALVEGINYFTSRRRIEEKFKDNTADNTSMLCTPFHHFYAIIDWLMPSKRPASQMDSNARTRNDADHAVSTPPGVPAAMPDGAGDCDCDCDKPDAFGYDDGLERPSSKRRRTSGPEHAETDHVSPPKHSPAEAASILASSTTDNVTPSSIDVSQKRKRTEEDDEQETTSTGLMTPSISAVSPLKRKRTIDCDALDDQASTEDNTTEFRGDQKALLAEADKHQHQDDEYESMTESGSSLSGDSSGGNGSDHESVRSQKRPRREGGGDPTRMLVPFRRRLVSAATDDLFPAQLRESREAMREDARPRRRAATLDVRFRP